MESYWNNVIRSRRSRRRALTGLAGLGLGAAGLSLLGCGDDGGKGAGSGFKDASGLLTRPTDTSKSAKRGGIFKDTAASDAQYFVLDQNLNGNGSDGIPGWVYSSLNTRPPARASILP